MERIHSDPFSSRQPPALTVGRDCLPEKLKAAKHWDYPPGLRWIPRRWTSFCWGAPELVMGNQDERRVCQKTGDAGPAPIGERGSWQISRFPDAPRPWRWIPLYLAFTLKNGRHVRLGARWDDVDGYVTFPTAASRRYSGEKIEDTSTL